MSEQHIPVLLKETIKYLHIKTQGLYIDATVGTGGHSSEILKLGGSVLGLDTDSSMLEIARKKLEKTCPVVEESRPLFKLIHANFRQIKDVAIKEGFSPADGVLFDLGVSSVHFDDMNRGFSFKNPDAPLDMRLDQENLSVTAADLVNSLRLDQLVDMFTLAMTRSEARRLSLLIQRARSKQKIETVGEFLLAGKFFKTFGKTHPATKAFMALRIAVNSELDTLQDGLENALEVLGKNGRMAVISFHSGEDRIVKDNFKMWELDDKLKILTKKPIKPGNEEVKDNPRARSANLRVIEKI